MSKWVQSATRLSPRIVGDRSVAKMPTDSSQQVTEGKDRMDWLPYRRQFGNDENPMFEPDKSILQMMRTQWLLPR